MPKVGIGIVTYNRLQCVKKLIEKIRAHTKGRYEIVVADDGSDDGTLKYLRGEHIRCITGRNRGVCWNKNRALFALEALNCDPILLIEDDCFPTEDGWDIYWRVASALWHHVSFAHPKLQPWIVSGAGTADNPYVNQKSTAQCAAASATLLRKIGFFDTRFKGYGVGHAEWTTRAKRAGVGFKRIKLEDGRSARANLYITGGVVADDAPTFKDRANIAKNEQLFEQIKDEPIYRFPWHTPEEKEEFRKEMVAAKIDNPAYFGKTAAAAPATPGLEEFSMNLEKSALYRKAITHVFGDDRSFIKKAGWIETQMTVVPTYKNEIVPWYNYACIHLLQSRRSEAWKKWRVLEFGAGYSTFWWSKRVAEVIAVEHDKDWISIITKLLGKNAKIIHRDSEDAKRYVKTAFEQDGQFQVIVVDGIHRELFNADIVKKLTPDGIVILDNSDRGAYAGFKASLVEAGFKELAMFGIGPMTFDETTTSVFYRPDNVMKI